MWQGEISINFLAINQGSEEAVLQIKPPDGEIPLKNHSLLHCLRLVQVKREIFIFYLFFFMT